MKMNRLARWACAAGILVAGATLAATAETARAGGNSATALLVIDVQNAYVDSLDLTTIDGMQLVDKLVTVVADARAAGLPVVYVMARDSRYAEGDPALDNPSAIAPLPGDPVVWKIHQNAFWDTELAGVLAGLGVRRILITGLATPGCIDATVSAARTLEFETWVIADAHSGGGPGVPEYYNGFWLSNGVTVKASEKIDFASLAPGGAATAEPSQVAQACSTALLVIDVQNAYVSMLDLTTLDGAELVAKLVDVLAAARAAGVPIVYVKHRDPSYAEGSAALEYPAAIAPLPDDSVVWKTHQNAFWDTELEDVLTALGARRVLITGLATTGCVNATVFAAKGLGYETWVVKDANAGGGTRDVIAYYNEAWPDAGIIVKPSGDIDFAAFGCLPSGR